jgi:hypothetical protein
MSAARSQVVDETEMVPGGLVTGRQRRLPSVCGGSEVRWRWRPVSTRAASAAHAGARTPVRTIPGRPAQVERHNPAHDLRLRVVPEVAEDPPPAVGHGRTQTLSRMARYGECPIAAVFRFRTDPVIDTARDIPARAILARPPPVPGEALRSGVSAPGPAAGGGHWGMSGWRPKQVTGRPSCRRPP